MRTTTFRKLTLTSGLAAIVGLAILAVGTPGAAAKVAAPQQSVSVEDYGKKFTLVGRLGKRIGTFMTIEGTTHTNGPMADGEISVEKIDGVKLEKPVIVPVREVYKTDGLHVEFRGYESCGLIGTPVDPKDKVDGPGVQQQPLHFADWFQITWTTPASELEKR